MNLKEIREEINSALDYNPDLKQYSDSVTRIVNRHYLQVSSQYQWLFMQERGKLMLRAPIKGSATDILSGDGSRVATLPSGSGIKNLPFDVEGQTLVISNVNYLITRRIDARTIVLDNALGTGNYTSWEIKYISYPMPKDCVEVLGIMDRGLVHSETVPHTELDGETPVDRSTTSVTTAPNRGRFMFLDARKEENLYLDDSDTGEPFVSIEEMHFSIRAPSYAPLLTVQSEEDDPTSNRALFTQNQTVEYCYTYLYGGQESAPSPVSVTTVGVSKAIIKVSDLINTAGSRLPGDEETITRMTGRIKKLYRRIITPKTNPKDMSASFRSKEEGDWRHIATLEDYEEQFFDRREELSTTARTVAGHPSATSTSSVLREFVDPDGDVYKHDRLFETGPRQHLRFWYTPSSDYAVEVRYHRRPFRLVTEADAPQWPVQYHHYLVYAALKDIALQNGMAAYSQIYEARAKDLLERMKSKYLSRTDRMYIRRGFDRAMADRERFGIPSKS